MRSFYSRVFGALLFFSVLASVQAGTATGISGLYFTAQDNTGAVVYTPSGSGTKDLHWNVTYASTDGGASANSNYMGDAYVVGALAGGWVANTANAGWITAPGATKANGNNANAGYPYLPGGGTGNKMGVFVYTLEFTIAGKLTDVIGSTVTNNLAISLTVAADDQFRIFLNPAGNGTTRPTGTPLESRNSAWTNTSPFTLANFSSGTQTKNTDFVIGKNYLVIEVDNTNNGNPSSLNASGLMMYQNSNQWVTIGDGNFVLIGGKTVPIPEAGVMLPIAGALGAMGLVALRRRRTAA